MDARSTAGLGLISATMFQIRPARWRAAAYCSASNPVADSGGVSLMRATRSADPALGQRVEAVHRLLKQLGGLTECEAGQVVAVLGPAEEAGARHRGDAALHGEPARELGGRQLTQRGEVRQDVVGAVGRHRAEA